MVVSDFKLKTLKCGKLFNVIICNVRIWTQECTTNI